ncbi:MAG: S41 family peptidase [Bryobacteraceae bacterium]
MAIARSFLAFLLVSVAIAQPLDEAHRKRNLDSFDVVWTTIRDRHWQKQPGGLDWEAIRNEYRPRVERAETKQAARQAMTEMLGRLHQTHFGIFPSEVYESTSGDGAPAGTATIGIDVRILGGEAVVTRLEPGSPAEKIGIRRGWVLASVEGKDLAEPIKILLAAFKDALTLDLMTSRAILSRLQGPAGESVRVEFIDGAGKRIKLAVPREEPRGQIAKFGNLPGMHVWFESKKIEGSEYIAFNMFFDPPRLISGFGDAVSSCMKCDGLVIDLRGNPGGIGGMAIGMAGWLIDKKNARLGTMYTRETQLNFVVNPRIETFTGPVAVLVDGTSASTSEIFAGGLKDLGRARIFGTRTAGAALPSVITKLPNGDGFQYAQANYISEGGKPLEGIGVIPDDEVKLTKEALLAGHDPVLEAALHWIDRSKKP